MLSGLMLNGAMVSSSASGLQTRSWSIYSIAVHSQSQQYKHSVCSQSYIACDSHVIQYAHMTSVCALCNVNTQLLDLTRCNVETPVASVAKRISNLQL